MKGTTSSTNEYFYNLSSLEALVGAFVTCVKVWSDYDLDIIGDAARSELRFGDPFPESHG